MCRAVKLMAICAFVLSAFEYNRCDEYQISSYLLTSPVAEFTTKSAMTLSVELPYNATGYIMVYKVSILDNIDRSLAELTLSPGQQNTDDAMRRMDFDFCLSTGTYAVSIGPSVSSYPLRIISLLPDTNSTACSNTSSSVDSTCTFLQYIDHFYRTSL